MNLFSLLIGIGASLGLMQVARRAPQNQELPWAVSGLLLLAAALAGARLNYVLIHPHLFAGNPWQVAQFWSGGLYWPGAFVGALLLLLIVAFTWRKPLGILVDGLFPLFPPVAVLAWLGCGQAGCAYGKQISDQFIWALPVVDERGLEAYRLPLPFLAAPTLLIAAWRVERLAAGRTAGVYACTGGLVLALHTLAFSWLRADPYPTLLHLRMDIAAALGLGGLCLLGLLGLGLARLRASISDKAPGPNRETRFLPKE